MKYGAIPWKKPPVLQVKSHKGQKRASARKKRNKEANVEILENKKEKFKLFW